MVIHSLSSRREENAAICTWRVNEHQRARAISAEYHCQQTSCLSKCNCVVSGYKTAQKEQIRGLYFLLSFPFPPGWVERGILLPYRDLLYFLIDVHLGWGLEGFGSRRAGRGPARVGFVTRDASETAVKRDAPDSAALWLINHALSQPAKWGCSR